MAVDIPVGAPLKLTRTRYRGGTEYPPIMGCGHSDAAAIPGNFATKSLYRGRLLARSLSDLGAVWPHNVVWLGGWCTRCSGGNEQFSRGGSGDGVSAAALGERVASRAASGAVCGGGGRKVRPESDDGRLSWCGFGVVPSGGVAGHPGLGLRERGIFEPQAGAGDV